MKDFKPRGTKHEGPEAKIQEKIVEMLTLRGWFVKSTHGNMYQAGFPDLYACHRSHGSRWIEVKNPEKYEFTDAQIRDFTKMAAEGVGIYVLTAATIEEYEKLFKPSNWYTYMSIWCS